MEQIKEIIVVEGRDDECAVKRAVNATVIKTSGFALSKKTLAQIKKAADTCGVIVLTDPDFVGEQIRKRIVKVVPHVKHAFIPRNEATLGDDIGVENATPESIVEALSKVRTQSVQTEVCFTQLDMIQHGLVGSADASLRRAKLGKILGIGYGNGKQFLNRLNAYGVTRDEFDVALECIERLK